MPIVHRSIILSEKERRAEKDKVRQARRIEQGLCRGCGGRKDRDVQHCDVCTERRRSNRLKSLYGISLEDYYELLAVHDGTCWICGKKEKLNHGVLVVDHDHKTGKVRGLLCDICNHGIGKFQDSVEILKRAAEYLQEFS